MLAVQGYYDGVAFQPLEKTKVLPNQKVIITIMDDFVEKPKASEEERLKLVEELSGSLAAYAIKDGRSIDENMQETAKKYLHAGNVWITLEAAAELVYVLNGVYKLERKAIAEKIIQFLNVVDCEESAVLHLALNTYALHNLDFVDCILYAYNEVKGIEIATFDKKLLRLLDNKEQMP